MWHVSNVRNIQKYNDKCTGRFWIAKMIEFCTTKRMILLVAVLIALCVIILYVENTFTLNDAHNSPTELALIVGSKDNCWQSENYSIKDDCKECTSFEKVSDHMPVCQITGFKELVACEKSGNVYKSCPRLPWLDKRNFWLFQFCMVAMGVTSWSVVFLRQKQLDYRMLQRIQKQISAGV